MESIIKNLYVGDDASFIHVENKPGWAVLRCCKEGPGGHRDTLGYTERSAPKGNHYLYADQLHRRSLNFIDAHDPHLIPREMVEKGLEFVDKRVADGDKVLIACNKGHSRGPTTALLYLRAIGELTGTFSAGERVFSTLYPQYEPGIGMRQFARSNWDHFDNFLRKGK